MAKLLSSDGLQSSGSVADGFDFSGDSAFPSFGATVFGLGPVSSASVVTAGGAAASATVSDSGSPPLVEVISGPLFVGGVDPIALSDVASGVRVEVDGGYLVGTAEIGAVTESQPIQFNGSSFTVFPIVFVDGDGLIVISGTNLGAALYGGHMIVSSGGVVGRTDVDQGVQDVLSGGVAIGAVVGMGNPGFFGDGGLQTVWAGGVASNTAILRGGTEDVFGTASGTSVGATGLELVESGGVIDGATLMGGTLQIESGGTAGSSTIIFSGGGLLKLDDATAFGGTLSGFDQSDSIDLENINFSRLGLLVYSGTALSGAYFIGDGAHNAALHVLGPYVPGVHLGDDGHGGTMVTVEPQSGTPIGIGDVLASATFGVSGTELIVASAPATPTSSDVVSPISPSDAGAISFTARAGGFFATFNFGNGGNAPLSGNFNAHFDGTLGQLAQSVATNFASGIAAGGQMGNFAVSHSVNLATPH